MHVVSAFVHEDMATTSPTKGPLVLRRYLEWAGTGTRPREIGRATGLALNALERDVWEALDKRAIPATPQWGESGYRIDFALADPDHPGRMVLALELDGDRYHRLPSVRDRDRLRQAHLERMGWRFHRVWASAWFHDPEGQVDLIEQSWREAVAASVDRRSAPEPAPAKLEPEPATRRLPRPPITPGLRIDQYTDVELDAVALWVLSDDLPQARETRLREMRDALGFRKAGRRIVERCTTALNRVREIPDGGS